jgi:hypothetical protein
VVELGVAVKLVIGLVVEDELKEGEIQIVALPPVTLLPVAQFPVSVRDNVFTEAARPIPVFPAYKASIVCIPEKAG